MRNFKKFLALVLAMLMVSACAVSVSAASFGDQAAINEAGVTEAVNTLVDLGVIKGRADGNFYPNDTLTREEACVILAKLRAGANGQKYEWVNATCPFDDVVDEWSFAYINYANRNGFMTGIGGNLFNPKGILTIEQALCAAVKAYKGGTGEESGLAKYADMVKSLGEPAYWATYWTSIADELGLTDGVNTLDYTASCSRGTMATIAYNLFKADASIADGFGLETLSGELTVVESDTVTLANTSIVRSVFEAALADNGFDGDLNDYIGAKFTVKYAVNSDNTTTVYSAALNSSMLVVDFTDGKLEVVLDSDDNNTNKVKLDGTTYAVEGVGSNNASTAIGGAGKNAEIDLTVTDSLNNVVAAANGDVLNDLPTYFKAFAYDDDNNGAYDRLVVKGYTLATIEADSEDAVDGVNFDELTFMNGNTFTNYTDDEDQKIAYTGVAAVKDEETPNLVHVAYNEGSETYVVDVLETAQVVTGLLTGIKNGSYVKIDGTTIKFNDEYVAPENWTLNQTVSVFTIDGKYVKVTTSSSASKTIMVDNVTIDANGNAVVTGYNVDGFGVETLTVVGIKNGTKLVARNAYQADNDDKIDNVYLATKKDASTKYEFAEGVFYTFTVTDKGAYYVATAGSIDAIANLASVYENFSVKNGYVYFGASKGVANFKTDGVTVLKINAVDDVEDLYEDAYAQTYTKTSTLSAVASATATLMASATDSDAAQRGEKVKLVVITETNAGKDVITSLSEGQTIVQVRGSAIESGFEYDTYEAVDLFSGEKITVLSNIGGTNGQYYVAKDGKLVENTTDLWVNSDVADITVSYEGLIGEITANTTKLIEKTAGEEDYEAIVNSEDKTYGIDQITIYEVDGNVIKIKDGKAVTKDVEDTLLDPGVEIKVADYGYKSYVVGDTMIIIWG